MAFINSIPDLPVASLTPELAEQLSFGPALPIVLFPVRLETRFLPLPDGGANLLVRVYPDKIHIDTHEPELTEEEIIWGKHFWEQTWRAADNEEAGRVAWRQLVDRFGARRAAWVARALKPLNPPNDRPKQFLANSESLPTAINFPAPQTRPGSWTRAPRTTVLPKNWHVLGYAGGQLTLHQAGKPIPDSLPVGPDPRLSSGPDSSIPEEFADDELQIDAGMKWMVDFAEAENLGMGIRATLNSDQAGRGFDFLLVCGTKAAADVTDSTPDLVKLLEAHHYTDGLSFVLQGTPSNNTPDAPSGFSSTDPGNEESYLAERNDPGFQPGDESNADVLTNALGLRNGNARTLAHIANGNVPEQLNSRHMNRALWPAGWGYFLTQMMGMSINQATNLTPGDLAWGREHFINYVRASGPLPAVRVGRQPYGIIPATSLHAWQPSAGQEAEPAREAALKDLLLQLRPLWHAKVGQVPRIGRTGTPEQDFQEIFSADGLSINYAIRDLMGEEYLRRLWSVLVPGDQKYWWLKQRELTRVGLAALAVNWNPRLAGATYSGWQTKLTGPAVQSDPGAEDAPLTPNYIDLLLNESDLEKIRRESFAEFQPKGLLYSLLRHSLLLEYWGAALKILFPDQQGIDYWTNHREQELVGPPDFSGFAASFPTIWELLARPMPGDANTSVGTSVGAFLAGLQAPPTDPNIASAVANFLEFCESLKHLKTVSAAKLQRLSAGSLDLCSYRLDAWITSLATRRLAKMRQANANGILIGGYGWVVNLKPLGAATPATPPAGEAGDFLRPPDNPGYTHAPSLAQAATVAVLRSGHLSHSDPTTKDLLAIDLSSERVRLAEWLLDGVRQGQPLGALLGYRFERRLQEDRLGQFIPWFREVAPLVANKIAQTAVDSATQSVESIAANNVADGLVLHHKWKNLSMPFGGSRLAALFSQLPKQPDPNQLQEAQTRLEAELDLLDAAVDAVSDAVLAESVHHAVLGNPLRTASTLDAIASGAAPPPELDVVRTPRTGIALTYRLITLFSASTVVDQPWPSPRVPFRADAEPHLNAWAARLLGSPAKVRCLIERFDPATAAVEETKELRLSELQMSPLDFVFAAEANREGQPSEIEARIVYAIRRSDGFAPDAALRINPGRGADWTVNELSYGEFAELLRTARRLITGARSIDGSELDIPERNQAKAVDNTELQARADRAEQALRQSATDLQALLDDPQRANLESLRDAILRSAHFGVAGSVPLSVAGDEAADRDSLLAQGSSIVRELKQRVEQLAALQKNFDSGVTSVDDQTAHQVARVRLVFGNSFVVLPQFTAANATELAKALGDSEAIQENDNLAVVTWFQRVSRVRDGVARFDDSMRYAEALETGAQLNLRIAQLPYREADRWVGLPLKTGEPLSASRFSLIVQAADQPDLSGPLSGLLIDEWVEVVPNPSETTGLVFQYDQPDAAPPQCILLAIPPDLGQPWNVWSLQQVLLETLDLARLRAVGPQLLDPLGHYLPALYFAVNRAGDTVSTDFSNLK